MVGVSSKLESLIANRVQNRLEREVDIRSTRGNYEDVEIKQTHEASDLENNNQRRSSEEFGTSERGRRRRRNDDDDENENISRGRVRFDEQSDVRVNEQHEDRIRTRSFQARKETDIRTQERTDLIQQEVAPPVKDEIAVGFLDKSSQKEYVIKSPLLTSDITTDLKVKDDVTALPEVASTRKAMTYYSEEDLQREEALRQADEEERLNKLAEDKRLENEALLTLDKDDLIALGITPIQPSYEEDKFVEAISDKNGNVDTTKLASMFYSMGIASSLSEAQVLAETMANVQSDSQIVISASDLATKLNALDGENGEIEIDDLVSGLFTTGTSKEDIQFHKQNMGLFLKNASDDIVSNWLSSMMKLAKPTVSDANAEGYSNLLMKDYPQGLENYLFAANSMIEGLTQLTSILFNYMTNNIQRLDSLDAFSKNGIGASPESRYTKKQFSSLLSLDGTEDGQVNQTALAQMLLEMEIAPNAAQAKELATSLLENNDNNLTAGELYEKVNALDKGSSLVKKEDLINAIFMTGNNQSNYEYNYDNMSLFLKNAAEKTRNEWLAEMIKQAGNLSSDYTARKYLSIFLEQYGQNTQAIASYLFGNPPAESLSDYELKTKLNAFIAMNAMKLGSALAGSEDSYIKQRVSRRMASTAFVV